MMLRLLFALLFLIQESFSSSSSQNIYDQPLQPCSTVGMAQTGYTRDGTCVDRSDDSGSHHICIDLSSTSSNGENFCQVTKQTNWCSDEMPCYQDSQNYCPVEDWCVCQWAFADYLQAAGDCGAIQEIKCEAVNKKALEAYRQMSNEVKYANALACLTDICNLSIAWE